MSVNKLALRSHYSEDSFSCVLQLLALMTGHDHGWSLDLIQHEIYIYIYKHRYAQEKDYFFFLTI